MNGASGTFVPDYLGTGITGIPAPVPEYEETRITTAPVQPNGGKFRREKRLSFKPRTANPEPRCKDLIFLPFSFLWWFWFETSCEEFAPSNYYVSIIIIVVIIYTLFASYRWPNSITTDASFLVDVLRNPQAHSSSFAEKIYRDVQQVAGIVCPIDD